MAKIIIIPKRREDVQGVKYVKYCESCSGRGYTCNKRPLAKCSRGLHLDVYHIHYKKCDDCDDCICCTYCKGEGNWYKRAWTAPEGLM